KRRENVAFFFTFSLTLYYFRTASENNKPIFAVEYAETCLKNHKTDSAIKKCSQNIWQNRCAMTIK
ncbi:MAG: hypothetical protein LBV75_06950, partial [Paludibacter sp.]|nr:hypothetical protein [Paludibacter sp.]